MQIQLEIINRTGLEPGISTRFTVGDAPVIIGRGKKADWELPDAGRFLSSSHCRVSPAKNGFLIAVLSPNGIVHNGKSLAQGAEARLAAGDRIEIGPYVMLASPALSETGSGERTVLLGRRAVDSADEKTVVQLGRVSAMLAAAGRAAKPDIIPYARKPDTFPRASASSAQSRAPSAARPAIGVEFVREFADGAGIDPDLLAGRTNLEFALELGGAIRNAVLGLGALGRSANEMRALVGSRSADRIGLAEESLNAADGSRMIASLFAVAGSDYRKSGQAVGDLADSLQAHDAAVFHAMQTALFRLLNELAPMTIETRTRSSVLRSKNAKNWDLYVKAWESLSFGRENGMLDVFLGYFREAYDDKMGGH